jgi:two-component system, sensor histidine kinase
MQRLLSIVVGALTALALFGTAQAKSEITPAALAERIEQRAEQTSFAGLRAFGDVAAKGHDRESLRRLQHVITVLQAQSEFELVEKYNRALAASAARQHDTRYADIARLNSLSFRYDQGETGSEEAVSQARTGHQDWFVQVFAETLWAEVLIDRRETGAALQLLLQTEQTIPAHDADGPSAESRIWEIIGLGLMRLNDLDGSARAFERSQFEFADPAYPRPDFDAVYNLGHMAIDLGDKDSAAKLVAVHHKLAGRTDLAHLGAWDANICGLFAEAFEGPASVLHCFAGLDGPLTDADFLSRSILPMRAIAEARMGRIEAARADLERLRAEAKRTKSTPMSRRIPEVEAELLLADGHSKQAYDKLRTYSRELSYRRANEVYGGVRQVTGSLQTQLETARHDVQLESQAVRAQRWVIVLGLFGFLATCFLIALQRMGAKNLRAAQARAEQANLAKSAFLATMSHEIRTPLNGVLGMAQAMSRDRLTGPQRERLDVIRQSGEALLAILNDVLDLSKIEAGKLEIEIVDFDLSTLGQGAWSAFTAIAHDKGLDFVLDIDDASGRYRGDPTRIRQILYNLISNALKFTERGEIKVTAAYDAGMLSLAVSDTGPGIAPANLPRLFAKFDQLDSSTTRRFGGTGLGLAICQELASLLGGDIGVTSVEGQGSCFTLTVPVERLGDEAAGVADAADEEVEAMALRVLAAEDNAVNQLVLKTLLEQVGVSPHVVADGRAAVEMWEEGEWDVILMDVQMPIMDGLAATAAIRRLEAERGRARTPIIALTANAMSHQIQEYLAAGMDGHVAKPISAAALYAALSDLGDPAADDSQEQAA